MDEMTRLTYLAEAAVLDIMADETRHTIDDLVEKCLKHQWAQNVDDPSLVVAAVSRVLEICQSGPKPSVSSAERGGDLYFRLN